MTVTLEITTPVDIPHDVLVEHIGYHLRELLLDETPTPIQIRVIGPTNA